MSLIIECYYLTVFQSKIKLWTTYQSPSKHFKTYFKNLKLRYKGKGIKASTFSCTFFHLLKKVYFWQEFFFLEGTKNCFGGNFIW